MTGHGRKVSGGHGHWRAAVNPANAGRPTAGLGLCHQRPSHGGVKLSGGLVGWRLHALLGLRLTTITEGAPYFSFNNAMQV
jgi:tetrahydromethanopterin S-methyltransferase subunit C